MATIQPTPDITQTQVKNGKIFEVNAPKVPNVNDAPVKGNPTQPALSRSIVTNTAVGASNNNLAHVCDITGSLKYSIAWVSLQIKELIEAIRKAIQGLWTGASGSPFADGVRTTVNGIKSMVKQINKLINKAKEVAGVVSGYINQLKELLAYIATIPARIAQFLKDCLSEATASIKDAITNAQQIVESQTTGSIKEAVTSEEQANTELTNAEDTTPGSAEGPVMEKP